MRVLHMIPVLIWLASPGQVPTHQETHGACSPAVLDTKGNVTIICHGVDHSAMERLGRVPAMLEQLIKQQVNAAELRARLDGIAGAISPAPTDPFRIFIIYKENDHLALDKYTFPDSDIPMSLLGFRHRILAQLPRPVPEKDDVFILRWRDEQEVSDRLTPTAMGNNAVIVAPREVMNQFGDRHIAFTYLKSRIEGPPQ